MAIFFENMFYVFIQYKFWNQILNIYSFFSFYHQNIIIKKFESLLFVLIFNNVFIFTAYCVHNTMHSYKRVVLFVLQTKYWFIFTVLLKIINIFLLHNIDINVRNDDIGFWWSFTGVLHVERTAEVRATQRVYPRQWNKSVFQKRRELNSYTNTEFYYYFEFKNELRV